VCESVPVACTCVCLRGCRHEGRLCVNLFLLHVLVCVYEGADMRVGCVFICSCGMCLCVCVCV
jgi:hypothetical protein